MAFWDEALTKLTETLVARTLGYALTLGLVVALLATTITMVMLGELVSVNNFIPQIKDGVWFVAEFFLLFAVVTVTSVLLSFREANIQEAQKQLAVREASLAERETKIAEREGVVAKRENEDMLTAFRIKLAGPWEIEFRSWSYSEDGEILEAKRIDNATFCIDKETQKLVINLHVRENAYFQRDELTVRAISIQPVKDPATLDYYHEARLELKNGRIADGPFFVHLEIESEGEQPVRLRGTWYDLDATFARAMKDMMVSQGVVPSKDLPTAGSITFRKL